jgi:hypothetical protein
MEETTSSTSSGTKSTQKTEEKELQPRPQLHFAGILKYLRNRKDFN